MGGVNSHWPGKKLNKKHMHNPAIRGAGGFKFNNISLHALFSNEDIFV